MGAIAVPPVARLEGVVRDYPWGSRTALARLQGRPAPTPGPEAELWFGAHASAPAHLLDGSGTRPLDEVIAADPSRLLGPELAERFDGRLPFLLKVLAIDQPLSLQAHPSADRAEAGFLAEEARRVPIDAPERTYRDPWPKPELLCAVTAVDALCGFRDPVVTRDLLERLGVGELGWLVHDLAVGGGDVLRDAVGRLLRLPRASRPALVASVVRGARDVAATGGAHAELAAWVVALGTRYPQDPGVAVALLLHHVHLEAGEAIHVPPGHLHAYLGGTGVEVMASSDSVVRGGLTGKHVDVDGLLSVVASGWSSTPRVPALPIEAGRAYPVPGGFFVLERLVPGDATVRLERRGPEIVLAVGGGATVVADRVGVELASGEAAFIPASTRSVTVGGAGPLFRASVPGTTLTR